VGGVWKREEKKANATFASGISLKLIVRGAPGETGESLRLAAEEIYANWADSE
jgi:hypothetical protein